MFRWTVTMHLSNGRVVTRTGVYDTENGTVRQMNETRQRLERIYKGRIIKIVPEVVDLEEKMNRVLREEFLHARRNRQSN